MAKKQLVIQTAFIGDVLLSIPLLKQIKKEFPNETLVYCCRKGLGDFLLKTQLVDEVIEVDKNNDLSIKDSQKKLKSQEYDFIVSPHESFRTLILISQLKANKKIGFHKFWSQFLFYKTIKRDKGLHDSLRQMSLFQGLKKEFSLEFKSTIDIMKKSFTQELKSKNTLSIDRKIPELYNLTFENTDNRGNSFDRSGNEQLIVTLAPGSTWATKMWPVENYKELTQKLISKNIQVNLIGSPDEKSLCNEISDKISGVKNYAGELSLFDSYKLLRESDVVVSNDSGAMHLAALSDRKIVSIFGPTVPSFGYSPWVSKSIIVEANLSCRPCGKHGAKKCPIKTHACMKNLSVNDVLNSVQKLV